MATATDVMTEALKSVKMLPPSVTGLSQATFGDGNVGGQPPPLTHDSSQPRLDLITTPGQRGR